MKDPCKNNNCKNNDYNQIYKSNTCIKAHQTVIEQQRIQTKDTNKGYKQINKGYKQQFDYSKYNYSKYTCMTIT